MNAWIQSILVLLILSNLVMVGSSRVWKCIRLIAVQGILLALLILATHAGQLTFHVWLLALVNVLVKSVFFPWSIMRAVRKAQVSQAIGTGFRYGWALMIGALLFPLALWIGTRLPVPDTVASPLIVPVALYTIFVGFFLFVSRKKAITQVLSYLLLENGIYVFGLALLVEVPFLVELGILLDLVGAIFVMGIGLFDISQSQENLDVSTLSTLKE